MQDVGLIASGFQSMDIEDEYKDQNKQSLGPCTHWKQVHEQCPRESGPLLTAFILYLAHFGVTKVQLWVRAFEGLQHVQFLLLITGRLPHLLLPLIIHHLLNHTSRLAIQISQLAILRLDFRDIYLRRGSNDMFPPLHLVHLVEM